MSTQKLVSGCVWGGGVLLQPPASPAAARSDADNEAGR